MFLLSLFYSTILRSLRFVLQHTFSLLSFQMAAVDRELANLSEERQEKSRRLNLKRMQHVSTLQQLSKWCTKKAFPHKNVLKINSSSLNLAGSWLATFIVTPENIEDLVLDNSIDGIECTYVGTLKSFLKVMVLCHLLHKLHFQKVIKKFMFIKLWYFTTLAIFCALAPTDKCLLISKLKITLIRPYRNVPVNKRYFECLLFPLF